MGIVRPKTVRKEYLMSQHDWVLDCEESRRFNEKVARQPFAAQFAVDRCSKCRCVRIAEYAKVGTGEMYVYKPIQWTWNPFKTLKSEPPCPAHW